MRSVIAIVLLTCLAAPVNADDLHGQVVAFQEGTIEIAVDGGHVHEGATVEITIQLPDIEDTAWVCSGKVSRIDGGHVFATVTEKSADPREGDLATIKSSH